MKAIIMAGGKGTRIASIASDIPKPMIPICGKPILEHQINCLKKYCITDIIIMLGHLGHIIKDYFGDGYNFGIQIEYFVEDKPLGSAGALFKIQEKLKDDFLLINGDIIFDIDFKRFIDFYKKKNAYAVLASHPNSHPNDSSLLLTDDEDCVTQWLSKEDERGYYKNLVNAGLHILSCTLLKEAVSLSSCKQEKIDLDRDVLKPLLFTKKIFAYKTTEYIKDMGTPQRYYQVENDMKCSLIAKRNLSQKQRAVFVDRDGTINKANGFVRTTDQFELIDDTAEAIRKINEAGFLCIVITNQPIIARGETSLEELQNIHNKLETELGKKGAFIDDIFFCPHHPDKGFEGERAEYKIVCECRKPKPGMLLDAAKKYNIDTANSFMVGDSEKDALAGIAAGCKSFLIGRDCKSLLDFVDSYLSACNKVNER